MSEVTKGVLDASLLTFEATANVTSIFVVPVCLARIAFLNVSGSVSQGYSSVIKGVVLYFVLIFGFRHILEILLALPEHFTPQFSGKALKDGMDNTNNVTAAAVLVPNILTWILESSTAVIYHAATVFHFLMTVILSAMAPIVFLLGCLLGIGLGIKVFSGLLVMVSAWPIVFSACDALHNLSPALQSMGGLSGLVSELVISFFKLAGPLAIAFFSLSSSAGQAVTTTMAAGLTSASFLANHSESFRRGFSGLPNDQLKARTLGDYGRDSSHSLAHQAGRGFRALTPTRSLTALSTTKLGASSKSISNSEGRRSSSSFQQSTDQRIRASVDAAHQSNPVSASHSGSTKSSVQTSNHKDQSSQASRTSSKAVGSHHNIDSRKHAANGSTPSRPTSEEAGPSEKRLKPTGRLLNKNEERGED